MLQAFEQYLQSQGKRMNTIRSYRSSIQLFLQWVESQYLMGGTPHFLEITYTDLLAYIADNKSKNNKSSTLNGKLNALKHFYRWLQKEGQIVENPTLELQLKQGIQRQPHDLLSWEELEQLYQNYPNQNLAGKRNKAMLGLLIYQALTTAEVTALEVQDLHLESGQVVVPTVSRSKGRTLDLEAHQILPLQFYVESIRPKLLENKKIATQNLFVSTGTSPQLANSLAGLLRRSKKVEGKLKSFHQLRASVLTHWLKTQNLREVQYKAGHRYVSSTERYRTDQLESLQDEINELHPLR